MQSANAASVEEAMVHSAVQQSLLECVAPNDKYVLSAVIHNDLSMVVSFVGMRMVLLKYSISVVPLEFSMIPLTRI